MRQLVWIIFLFALGIGIAVLAQSYSGNVYIHVAPYMVRMDLRLFIIGLIVLVAALYFLFRLFAGILGTPDRLARFGSGRKSRRAAQALNAAGLAYFEGKFQEAEQQAAKVLANKQAGGNRVLALLLAAHAAAQSGDEELRNHYLKDIAKLPEKDQLSRHLLMAESALAAENFTEADLSLKAAAQINPRLTRLVRLQLQLALAKNDALDILDKTDKLQRAGAAADAEVRQYTVRAYRSLLRMAQDAAGLKACLKRIPEHLKDGDLCADIARRYQELGLYPQAVSWVNKHYPKSQNADLLPYFVESTRYLDDREQQKAIDTADAWLQSNPNDPRLLLHLGELAYGKQLWGKAQSYLEASLSLSPGTQARLVLAKVLDQSGKPAEAEAPRRRVLSEIGGGE